MRKIRITFRGDAVHYWEVIESETMWLATLFAGRCLMNDVQKIDELPEHYCGIRGAVCDCGGYSAHHCPDYR